MGEVIKLNDNLAIYDLVKELESLVEKNRVSDAVVVYRVKRDKNKNAKICRYWFGEGSSIMCVGLCDYMGSVIKDYIRDYEGQSGEELGEDMNPDD